MHSLQRESHAHWKCRRYFGNMLVGGSLRERSPSPSASFGMVLCEEVQRVTGNPHMPNAQKYSFGMLGKNEVMFKKYLP